jgi:O-6-methylguanine DNA methyltransferase
MKRRFADRIATPLGVAWAVVDEHGALVHLDFERRPGPPDSCPGSPGSSPASSPEKRRGQAGAWRSQGSGDPRKGGRIPLERNPKALQPLKRALERYFRGELRSFDLPLAPEGTPFQRRVWRALCRVPYGATVSYGELARRIGRPGASRAVGRANATNPISIVIPCHRVIGADGTLTGYGGGLGRKQRLLELEARGAAGKRRSRGRARAQPATPAPISA